MPCPPQVPRAAGKQAAEPSWWLRLALHRALQLERAAAAQSAPSRRTSPAGPAVPDRSAPSVFRRLCGDAMAFATSKKALKGATCALGWWLRSRSAARR